MESSPLRGSCLCGAVIFEVSPPFQRMLHCHCSRCRKATGTGHATNLLAGPDSLTWLSGEERIGRFDLPSAKHFSKWFCRDCGSPLPRPSRNGLRVIVPAGALDSTPPIEPSENIYWTSRAPWGCGDQGLPVYDEYPPGL